MLVKNTFWMICRGRECVMTAIPKPPALLTSAAKAADATPNMGALLTAGCWTQGNHFVS